MPFEVKVLNLRLLVFDRRQDHLHLDMKITDHVRTRIIEMDELNVACAEPDGIKIYVSEPRMPHIQKNHQTSYVFVRIDYQKFRIIFSNPRESESGNLLESS